MNFSKMNRLLAIPSLALAALATGSLLEGYTLKTTKWGTSTVSYYVNPQNKWVSQNAAVSAIQIAASAWRDQSNANISLAYAGSTSGSSLQMNYKSEVFFRGGGGPVAEAYVWWDGSGKYVDGDIAIYEDAYQFFAFSGCSSGIYIENVVIHEFGHFLGLGHSFSGVTMQPAMPGYCDREQLSLEDDDIAGIRALYPPNGDGAPAPAPAPAPEPTPTPEPAPAPPPPPPTTPSPAGITLAAQGYKVKGLQMADLSWSGLSADSVDVYRNGALVSTVGNSGAFTDDLNKRGGSGVYTYKVCGSGTSTCSNDATVSF